ncbi:Hypothetical protein ERS075660_02915 [Mycobacteroides abscessus]|nr:Hypothetical protein ERS075660_02915 [Mycobacteroides abscessus]
MGKKQIQKEHWEGHDHQSIYNAAQAFQTGNPQAAQESINSIAEQLGDIMHTLGGKVQGMLVEDWRGAAAKPYKPTCPSISEPRRGASSAFGTWPTECPLLPTR